MTQESCLMQFFLRVITSNYQIGSQHYKIQTTRKNTWINFQEAVTGAAQTILGRPTGTKALVRLFLSEFCFYKHYLKEKLRHNLGVLVRSIFFAHITKSSIHSQ